MKKFIYSIIAMLGIMMPTSTWADEDIAPTDGSYNEAYVVLQMNGENDAYLTLYYDDKKSSHTEGTVVGLNELRETPEIMQSSQIIHSVIIDPTFANARLTSTSMMFTHMFGLQHISGMEYLNTSEVTDMSGMFMECVALEEIDLSHLNTSKVTSMNNMFAMNMNLRTLDLSSFDTSNVTDMGYMFGGCNQLTTITVSDKWSTANVTEKDNYMFGECTNLIGGMGTAYNENNTGVDYARIDTKEAPGYLTGNVIPKAATPTFGLQNERLVITTETADATIYYLSAEWKQEAELDSLDRVLTAGVGGKDNTLYTEPIELNKNIILKAYAAKEGMEDSPANTLVYDFDSWKQLYDAILYGDDIRKRATGIEGLDQSVIQNLDWALEEGRRMYGMRIEVDRSEAKYFTNAILEACKNIESQIAALNTAEFNGSTLTVQGQLTMNDALAKVEGRDKVSPTIAAIVWNSSVPLTTSDLEGFDNPNMLIFVKEASMAPEGRNNVVVNGVAKNVVLTNTASGNNNFYSPMEFTAENISYTREFKQKTQKDVSRGWEGIALPFTVQTFTHETHGAIAPFGNDASSYHFWLHQMTDKGMEKATTIEAGKPYIISMPNSSSYPDEFNQAGKVTFAAQNATIPVTLAGSVKNADETITMVAAFAEITQDATWALNVGTEVEGHAEGSAFVKELRKIRPFEVYTFHQDRNNSGVRIMTVSSFFGGGDGPNGTTGINAIEDVDQSNDSWFDLNGRRLQGKPTQKGVYIKNGKKLILK